MNQHLSYHTEVLLADWMVHRAKLLQYDFTVEKT